MPPVTALRSPPDSRITGALSPVITDSSTVAMPSITSPSPGIRSPASQTTTSPARSVDAGTCSILPAAVRRLGQRIRFGLAQAVGLGFAARFRHGFGEIGEQHREPQPERDLQARSRFRLRRSNMSRIRNTVVSAAPTSTTNITGFFIRVTGIQFPERRRGPPGRRFRDRTAAATAPASSEEAKSDRPAGSDGSRWFGAVVNVGMA